MADEDGFWALIAAMRGRGDDRAVARLIDRLAEQDPGQITRFADRLAQALHALDTPAHAAAVRPFAVGDDTFLYVRCAAVAAGRSAYDRVLARPQRLARFAEFDAELLLTAAAAAYERRTGLLWEHESPVGYEMGANAAAWGLQAPDRPDAPLAAEGWLTVSGGWVGPGRLFDELLRHVARSLAGDPRWAAWWAGTGVAQCRLALLLDPTGTADPGVTVKRGRARIEAGVARHPAPLAAGDPAGLLPRAAGEILAALRAVGARCGLPEPPSLPRVELPEGFADLVEEPIPPIPPLPRDLVKRLTRRGGLTAAAIESYYRHHPNAPDAEYWLAAARRMPPD